MRRTCRSIAAAAVVTVGFFGTPLVAAGGAQTAAPEQAAEATMRIGWAKDLATLNPFTATDTENYAVWTLNWDQLVNLDAEDLSPAPGIAESWTVSEDRKTVTFKLVRDATWSDGEPITAADVKFSLEVLGTKGMAMSAYTQNVTSIETPDEHTVVIETSRPDNRIVGGLFIFIIPEHIWGDVPIKELTGSYKPELPLVGSGPFVVTQFDRGRIVTMERNPRFRGPAPKLDRIQFIKYGNQDAVERALQLGEIDVALTVTPSTFKRLQRHEEIATVRGAVPSYLELGFNVCPTRLCPDAERNPAVQDRTVRQALAHAIDRERIVEIATQGTASVGHGIVPPFYEEFYAEPEQDYPFDPDLAKEMLDDAGWRTTSNGPRSKGGTELAFELYAGAESPNEVRMARLVAEQAQAIGVEIDVQVVSYDKLTELATREVDGKPAPAYDMYIWGWSGDADPNFMLSVLTTDQIGFSSDSFYSNPEYDRLFTEQAGAFDTEARAETIREMVAIAQRDLPYLVLTYNSQLQAYRTDRLSGVEPTCLGGDGGILCGSHTYESVLAIGPAEQASEEAGGGSALPLIAGAIVVLAGGALALRRLRRRGEPVELEA